MQIGSTSSFDISDDELKAEHMRKRDAMRDERFVRFNTKMEDEIGIIDFDAFLKNEIDLNLETKEAKSLKHDKIELVDEFEEREEGFKNKKWPTKIVGRHLRLHFHEFKKRNKELNHLNYEQVLINEQLDTIMRRPFQVIKYNKETRQHIAKYSQMMMPTEEQLRSDI